MREINIACQVLVDLIGDTSWGTSGGNNPEEQECHYFIYLFCRIISLPELKLNIDASSIKALRAGRVLRPLKLVSGIPSRFLRVHHLSQSILVCVLRVLLRAELLRHTST